jgi:ATP-dependent DNA ligase
MSSRFRNRSYAFDLIELNGDDLRREPLEVRKATLSPCPFPIASAAISMSPISTPSASRSLR